MRYYAIRQSSDPKIAGLKDGGSQAEIDPKGFGDRSNYENYIEYFLNDDPSLYWKRLGVFPDFKVNLECVRLRKKASLTDFLSYEPCLFHGGNFLISDKALRVLSKFNISAYTIYPATVRIDKLFCPYNLLYCAPLGYEYIDFKNTIFFKGGFYKKEKAIFSLRDGEEFEMKKENDVFQSEKISLVNFDPNLDYFLTKISIPDIYISERLKNAIEEEDLSGLNIVEPLNPVLEFR